MDLYTFIIAVSYWIDEALPRAIDGRWLRQCGPPGELFGVTGLRVRRITRESRVRPIAGRLLNRGQGIVVYSVLLRGVDAIGPRRLHCCARVVHALAA